MDRARKTDLGSAFLSGTRACLVLPLFCSALFYSLCSFFRFEGASDASGHRQHSCRTSSSLGQPMPKRPGVKASQLSDQSANSVLHSVPLDRSRPGDAQRVIRPVSTRNDAEPNHTGKTQPRGGVSHRNGDSTSLLKRSLSKLRLNDATSPNRQKPPQATRQHLAPASRIPQATSPASCTRIICDHGSFRFRVPLSRVTRHQADLCISAYYLQPTSPRQADHHHDRYGTSPPGSTLIPKPSPARPTRRPKSG